MASEAIASLRDKATGELEFGIAFDADDPDTGAWAAAEGFAIWASPQRLGWKGLATYYARISELCSGEWLVWWGDDGRMLTDGWDATVREQEPGVLYLRGQASD